MPKTKKRMSVTLDIEQWVLLRDVLRDTVEVQGGQYMSAGDPMQWPRKLIDKGDELDKYLTSCIDDFHDLH